MDSCWTIAARSTPRYAQISKNMKEDSKGINSEKRESPWRTSPSSASAQTTRAAKIALRDVTVVICTRCVDTSDEEVRQPLMACEPNLWSQLKQSIAKQLNFHASINHMNHVKRNVARIRRARMQSHITIVVQVNTDLAVGCVIQVVPHSVPAADTGPRTCFRFACVCKLH